MKRLLASAVFISVSIMGYGQTPFSNSTEGTAVPILQLSSGTGTVTGSGGSIEFYKGSNLHPMGRIYTANMYSSGVNSQGKLILSSYYNAYKDEMTLFNGNVGIGTNSPAYTLDVNGTGQFAGGAKIGNGSVGFYGDGANHAVRAFNVANSGFHVQPYNGTATYFYVGQMGPYAGNVGIGTTLPNARLSFGTNVGYPAIQLYDGLAGNRFGMGIQNVEMQMYVGTNAHFSWNSGGDLQPSGTNELMRLSTSGALCIGTTNPGTMKLAVEGNIGARKIIVTQVTPFPDYVFKSSYQLRTLTALESYIKKYSHLPEVPSARKVEKEGLDIGSIQAALLRKIEELTLYVIDLNKKIEILEAKK